MNLRAAASRLVLAEHDLCEVGDFLPDLQQRSGRNDDLELRNENSVSTRAIPNANISATSVLLQYIGYVIGRDLAQHFRWELLTSHGLRLPVSPRASTGRISNLFFESRKTQSRHATDYFAYVKPRVEQSFYPRNRAYVVSNSHTCLSLISRCV